MPVLMQVCAIAITIAVIAVSIALIRTLNRLMVTTDELTRTAETIRSSVAQAEAMTRQLRELATDVRSIVPPIQKVANRFGDLGERAAGISNALFAEVEAPVRNTLALITGLRTGARTLLGAISHRVSQSQSNGGYRHE
jgi:uncharacterized protein YoxC